MNLHTLKILIATEARLRLRRLSTLITLLAVVAFGWWMFADQSSGMAFIVIDDARVLNTSATIALGSVSLFSMIFGLAGFYLTRGRISEDLRCGTGAVIGSTAVGDTIFLTCRWLGGVSYLLVMAIVFMLTMMVCHLFRGVGPIEPGVYIETFAVVLIPLIFFSVSCAVLFDSIAPLMGKLGDVVYFFLWVFQFSAMTSIDDHAPVRFSGLMLIDFSGIIMTIKALFEQFHSNGVNIGYATFNPALPGLMIDSNLWTAQMILMRLSSGAIACLVLVPAFFVFHRYSSDKVKVKHSSARRSPIEILNQLTRPLTRFVQPVFGIAGRMPGIWGAAVADLALTLSTAPAAILAILILTVCGLVLPSAMLMPVLLAAATIWGIIVSDISTRDFTSAAEDMTGVTGGSGQRYLRQWIAAVLLGLLFFSVAALRLTVQHPHLGLALLVGLCSLSALANLFGRTARTPRLFLSLFLFWVYVAVQVPTGAFIDILAFNGVANMPSTVVQLMIAAAALALGYAYNGWERGR